MSKKEMNKCEKVSCGCHNYEHHEHENHEHKPQEHEHCHDERCHCNDEHNHKSHSHGCGCEGEHVDNRKLIAGVAVFIVAFIVFHIPGLFKSFDAELMDTIELIVFLGLYLLTAKDIVVNAIKNVFKGKALDEQFLMTIASLGAFFVGEYSEACAVMLFYLVGEAFQDYAVDKSRKSIVDLMDIRPDTANIIGKDGSIKIIDPHKVKVGDIILVKPGEKIPLDGIIVEGHGDIDTKALTGESLPKEVCENSEVISGSISINGTLTIKATKSFGDSTVSKILEMVEHVSEKKAKTEKFITRFAKIYTPIVVALAIAIAVVMPLTNCLLNGADITDFYGVWNDWIYRALTFLVISCPCALVVSVPLSFFAGVGLASSKGILVKGTNYLEAMAECKKVVCDKTGTLTEGTFNIVKVESNIDELELIKTATVAEMLSSHPIALSFKEYLKNNDAETYENLEKEQNKIKIENVPGKGIIANYKDSKILAGNEKLLKEQNIDFVAVQEIGTIVYVAKDGQYLGYVVIADKIKEDSKEAIVNLKKLGVEEIVMLTGDKKEIAEQVAEELWIDEFYAELLPDDKVEKLESLLDEKNKLAFVGDGINDAPVLARADVGIAMGALGSDAAIEAADVVIMDDSLKGIVNVIKIARKTKSIAKQNIAFALAVKIAVLALASVGLTTMWAAVFADVGVCVIAIINAMRCSKYKGI